jgi:hypothetical protein
LAIERRLDDVMVGRFAQQEPRWVVMVDCQPERRQSHKHVAASVATAAARCSVRSKIPSHSLTNGAETSSIVGVCNSKHASEKEARASVPGPQAWEEEG